MTGKTQEQRQENSLKNLHRKQNHGRIGYIVAIGRAVVEGRVTFFLKTKPPPTPGLVVDAGY